MENLSHGAILADKLSGVLAKGAKKLDKALAKMIDDQNPTFENPVFYKIVHPGGALVRKGYETNTAEVRQLACGEEVVIVEVRGRRAKMVKPITGWLSLRTMDGVPIAKQSPMQNPLAKTNMRYFENTFEEKFKKLKKEEADEKAAKNAHFEEEFARNQNSVSNQENSAGGGGMDLLDLDMGGGNDNTNSAPSGGSFDGFGMIKPADDSWKNRDVPKLSFLSAPKKADNSIVPSLGAPPKARNSGVNTGGGNNIIKLSADTTTTKSNGHGSDGLLGMNDLLSSSPQKNNNSQSGGGDLLGFDMGIISNTNTAPAPTMPAASNGLDLLGGFDAPAPAATPSFGNDAFGGFGGGNNSMSAGGGGAVIHLTDSRTSPQGNTGMGLGDFDPFAVPATKKSDGPTPQANPTPSFGADPFGFGDFGGVPAAAPVQQNTSPMTNQTNYNAPSGNLLDL